MNLVIFVALAFVIVTSAFAQSGPDTDRNQGDLKSEEAQQKIYDIISSHEDRKYGDHGGHEYEEGEVPKRLASRKSKIYGYVPTESKYYYPDQPQKSDIVYEPKKSYANKPYALPVEAKYPVPKEYYPAPKEYYPQPKEYYPEPKKHYPVVEAVYSQPKRGYITRDNAEAVRKRYNSVYAVPKESDYQDRAYIENKNAPITIGQTARTVYASPVSNTHYASVDPKTPSEYIAFDGRKPKPLILDPKLKATYHLSQPDASEAHYTVPEHQVIQSKVPGPVYKTAYVPQPVAHYSAPEHHVIVKPEVSVPVHYPAPSKKYIQYDDHKVDDHGYHASGHGHHGDNSIKKESGHKSHGHHEIAGHKAHSSVGGQHDEHARHHNRGLYERDRGYHYEKAYAYDRIRSHHDIGSDKGSHSKYGAHHGHEAHKDAGHHGAETHSYFKKDDHGAGYGYQNGNTLYKKGHNHGQKYVPVYYHR